MASRCYRPRENAPINRAADKAENRIDAKSICNLAFQIRGCVASENV